MTLAHMGVSLVVAGKDGGDGSEHRPSWAVLITGGSCCSVLQSLGSNAIELHGGEFQPGPKCDSRSRSSLSNASSPRVNIACSCASAALRLIAAAASVLGESPAG